MDKVILEIRFANAARVRFLMLKVRRQLSTELREYWSLMALCKEVGSSLLCKEDFARRLMLVRSQRGVSLSYCGRLGPSVLCLVILYLGHTQSWSCCFFSLLAVLGYPGSSEVHTDILFSTVQKSLFISGREGKTLFLYQNQTFSGSTGGKLWSVIK